ncbi:hypothetical protein D3C86_2031620 [compost metagenome]
MIDRESAYEMLNKKVQDIQKEAAEAEEKVQEQKQEKKETSEPMSQTTKSIIKVFTSATFIRGVFGVLTKIFKK